MIATIQPSAAHGRMTAPPSKSMAHRLLICAALAEGTSVIRNIELSQDILATIDCLKALARMSPVRTEKRLCAARKSGKRILPFLPAGERIRPFFPAGKVAVHCALCSLYAC